MENTETETAYGGDPLAPNDVVLGIIAAVIDGGEPNDLATRWAKAFKTVCPEPNTPKRILLGKVAEVVASGKADDEVTAWAKGETPAEPRSVHNLDHLH
jgi:hypothetical protein